MCRFAVEFLEQQHGDHFLFSLFCYLFVVDGIYVLMIGNAEMYVNNSNRRQPPAIMPTRPAGYLVRDA